MTFIPNHELLAISLKWLYFYLQAKHDVITGFLAQILYSLCFFSKTQLLSVREYVKQGVISAYSVNFPRLAMHYVFLIIQGHFISRLLFYSSSSYIIIIIIIFTWNITETLTVVKFSFKYDNDSIKRDPIG